MESLRMDQPPRGTALPAHARSRRSGATIAAVLLIVLLHAPQGAAQTQSLLSYAWGLFVTGDYVVGGVDVTGSVDGFATGTIRISGVPAHAEVLAAFLYWETITLSSDPSQARGVEFRGQAIDVDNTWLVRRAGQPLTGQTASCWSAGTPLTMHMLRADVLSLLPVEKDANGNLTGRRVVNDADLQARNLPLHTVKLPKFGTGNVVPESAGASLVVVYRDLTQPLRKIVIYDGIHVLPPDTPMSQQLQGFYQSAATKSAKLTHIAASGQKNPTERLSFNGSLIATDPFPDSSKAASDRAWANPTFDVSSLMPGGPAPEYGETAVTGLTHHRSSPYECLTWGAVIFSTAVQDADGDGIPDGIEDAPVGSPRRHPSGELLPDLAAMGAGSQRKNVFVEFNAMWAPPGTSYGAGPQRVTDSVGHSHLPSPQVLKMIGDAFRDAPVQNPDGSTGISAHFDVGNLEVYRSRGVVSHPDWVDDFASREADEYLIPSHLARGGELIEEKPCVATEADPCPFPDYPGTVAWKLGFDALKYAPVGEQGQELTSHDFDAWVAGPSRRVRFDPVRIGLFHYVLYAHARGMPKSLFPCLDAEGKPTGYDANGGTSCARDNPDLRTPSSASGVADLPGGSAMVSLGLWDGFVGRPFIQASTTVHELGHNFDLWHGGFAPTWGTLSTPTYVEPNCKPNYLSVMSYLFQARGLVDESGRPHVDFSRTANVGLDENFLTDGLLASPLDYRTSWFAPLVPGTLGYALGIAPARRFCNGAPLPHGWPASGRIDGGSVWEPIDWDGDGYANSVVQDVNFDGVLTGDTRRLRGFNDWANLRLDHVGSGLNAFGRADGLLRAEGGGIFTLADGGILKHEGGGLLRVEGGGLLRLEGGGLLRVEGGGLLTIEGVEDGGLLRAEGGGLLRAEGGGLLKAEGGGQELSLEHAHALGRIPPTALTACVLGVDCTGAPTPLHRTRLQWEPPTIGRVSRYRVYRVTGGSLTLNSPVLLIAEVPSATRTLVDEEELPDGVLFTYFVTAVFDDETPHPVSGPSNTATIRAVNVAPVAATDTYATSQNTALVVAAPGVLGNDTDADSPPTSWRAVLVSHPASGSLQVNPDGSFTYTPNTGFNGIDTFTYKANNGVWSRDPRYVLSSDSNVVTVSISVGSSRRPR
jgi:hypothetical protein